jgi:hypothetical protein
VEQIQERRKRTAISSFDEDTPSSTSIMGLAGKRRARKGKGERQEERQGY